MVIEQFPKGITAKAGAEQENNMIGLSKEKSAKNRRFTDLSTNLSLCSAAT
jgi:hypothetical protein